MITSAEFDKAYSAAIVQFSELRERCDPRLRAVAEREGGMFSSRIKSPESVYSKLETGRFRQPFIEMWDIYAATIALPIVSRIENVCEGLGEDFEEVDRRSDRSSRPVEFVYDDLHLILRLRPTNLIPSQYLFRLRFELQVKSLLQFAWSKATHETIYKAKEVSWQQDRLAAEARAGLELIDSLLADVSRAAVLQLEKENADYVRQQALVSLLVGLWSQERLPEDLRRCAGTIDVLLRLALSDSTKLIGLLGREPGKSYVTAVSLTPVQAVLAALIDAMTEDELAAFAARAKRRGVRFFVSSEMKTLALRSQLLPESSLVRV